LSWSHDKMPVVTTNIISKITENGLNSAWGTTGGKKSYLCIPLAERMEWVASKVVGSFENESQSNKSVNSFKLRPVSLNAYSANHIPPCATQLRITGLKSTRIR
jgi:hypothetical protein